MNKMNTFTTDFELCGLFVPGRYVVYSKKELERDFTNPTDDNYYKPVYLKEIETVEFRTDGFFLVYFTDDGVKHAVAYYGMYFIETLPIETTE